MDNQKVSFDQYSDLPFRKNRIVNSVLILDHHAANASALYRAFKNRCENTKHQYQYAIIHIEIGVEKQQFDLARVERALLMDSAEFARHDRSFMLRLRAIIFNSGKMGSNVALCKLIRTFFPSIFLGYTRKEPFESRNQRTHFESVYDCHCIGSGRQRFAQGAVNALRTIDRRLDGDFHTPYWDALREYISRQHNNFHSLPVAQMHSASPSIADFTSFYGKGLFGGETSLSTFPLDSLLNPQGAIQHAQAKAALAFGPALFAKSRHENYGTRFVTTGTSSANRIVISTYVRPNDLVLLDRSCHISHYYALAYSHARPILIEPDYNFLGIALPPGVEKLKSALEQILSKYRRLPAAIILTNPTFDGVYCQPQRIVRGFRSVLSSYWQQHCGTRELCDLIQSMPSAVTEACAIDADVDIDETSFLVAAFRSIVFLFDEAWSAHSFFHPRLVRYTAMHSAIQLASEDPEVYAKSLRFYATQSTHKSLSAFRQGSMIHYRDPVKHLPDFEQLFAQSFRAHTTTSPNSNIIASLDVARRQAQIDGLELVERCFHLAMEFRDEFSRTARPSSAGFNAVEDTVLLASRSAERHDSSTGDFFVDPARVTITWDLDLCGSEVRRLLLEQGIQINKFETRSILVIFHIGSTEESVEKLRRALLLIENGHFSKVYAEKKSVDPGVPPAFRTMHDENNLGWWLKNLGNHHRHVLDVEECYKDMLDSRFHGKRLVAANFGIPYPPGYPILMPGQVVEVSDLRYLSSIAAREILGAHRVDGRLKMAFYVFPDDGPPAVQDQVLSDSGPDPSARPHHVADAPSVKDLNVDEH